MLQLLWALMTWRQRTQTEASVWALMLDTRLQASGVPPLRIFSYSWWALVTVCCWPCRVTALRFPFTIGCCKHSVNRTVIGRISPPLSGRLCFAAADVAEKQTRCKFITPGSFKCISHPFLSRFLSLPLCLGLPGSPKHCGLFYYPFVRLVCYSLAYFPPV